MEVDVSLTEDDCRRPVHSEGSRRKRARSEDEQFEDFRQVGLVYDEDLIVHASKLSNIIGRARAVHNLINAYNLLQNVTVYESIPATEDDLRAFHSSDYIAYLKEINSRYTPDDDVELEYGLGYDCPPLDGIFEYCQAIGGATLTAARSLIRGEVDVAINWCGGWHHAQRDEAEGFCYINDVVLGILELRTHFSQILYVDLDVHHGNGVETSFERSRKVLTLSLHQYESGFYPGTGASHEVGFGSGRFYSVNVPLKEGICDERYCSVFDRVWRNIMNNFEPNAVVVQCGADGLSGDPLGEFNLTPAAYGHCIKRILSLKKPTLVLGGGGYNIPNVAKCWTFLTAVMIGIDLDPDIPENDDFPMYGPNYELSITPSNRKDYNTEEFLKSVLEEVESNLSNI